MARIKVIKRSLQGKDLHEHEEDHLHIYGGVFNGAKFGEGFELIPVDYSPV